MNFYDSINRTPQYLRFFLLMCAVFGYFTKGQAQAVVEMELDTAEILVGQQARLSASVTVDAKQQVQFPSYKVGEDLVKGLEVLETSATDTTYLNDKKRMMLKRTYTVTAFDSALFSLPPIQVVVDADTFSVKSPIGLKVNTVPVDTTKLDAFAGPHIVVPAQFVWRNQLLLLGLGCWAILLLFVVVSVKLTRHKPLTTKKVISNPIPPSTEVKDAVSSAKSITIRDTEDAKRYYVVLTDALRVYLQKRFAVKAMEQTTDEILQSMDGKVAQKELEDLKFIFETADLVKFAKVMPSEFDNSRCIELLNQFMAQTYDEELEHPKPEVQIVVLNDGMQKKYRSLLWSSFVVLAVGGLVYALFVGNLIYQTYY